MDRSTVIGWCSVSRRGQPLLVKFQYARTHALVVVDDVEVTATVFQDLRNTHRVRERLTESPTQHHCELRDIGDRRELRARGNAKGIGVAVEIERAYRREAHALVEFGPRRTGEDFHTVAQVDQLSRQMAGVHTLTTAARVTAIDKEGHAVLARLGRPRGNVVRRRDCL